jgi:hypothetical protein
MKSPLRAGVADIFSAQTITCSKITTAPGIITTNTNHTIDIAEIAGVN